MYWKAKDNSHSTIFVCTNKNVMARLVLVLAAAFILSLGASAQLREIPKEVKQAFESQYPTAQKVEYRDNLIDVHVVFYMDSTRMVAEYTNKGVWKETEKAFSYDKVNQEIKDGFAKSKYAEWPVTEATIVEMPSNEERIRIKVEKGELTKRYLFFNKQGRLIRDSMTL